MIGRTIYEDLFGIVPSKSQQRMVEIAEATIKTYVKLGVDAATYEKIAKTAKVSRPLILHYFPDYDTLFLFVARYIRATFQNYVLTRVAQQATPDKQLRAYVESCFEWSHECASHAKVWGLFYFYCAIKPKFEALNTDLVKMGAERLSILIEYGNKSAHFKCKNPAKAARQIQIHITGAMTSLITESRDFNADLKGSTVDLCMMLVEVQDPKKHY